MQRCERADELSVAYALGVLEPGERAEHEAHLQRCEACRSDAQAEQSVVAALALAVPQVSPPPRLKAQLMIAARAEASRPSFWRALFPTPLRTALGAASFASLAFAVALSWGLGLQAQLAARSSAPPLAAAPSSLPDDYGNWTAARAQMRRLAGSETAPDARGWIYLDPTVEDALLVAYKLPPLSPDKAYQLWLVSDGQRVSGGVFDVDPEGYGWLKVRAPSSFASYQRVGITVEPRTGSPGPTGARVLGGEL